MPSAEGAVTRRLSSLPFLRTHQVEESEFFAAESTPGAGQATASGAEPGKKPTSSLANVAAREVLLSFPLGGLSFAGATMESDWQTYAAMSYASKVLPTSRAILRILLLMVLIMGAVTLYLHFDGTGGVHRRDDALYWTIALGVHAAIALLSIVAFSTASKAADKAKAAALVPSDASTTATRSITRRAADAPAAGSLLAQGAHYLVCGWFALWLATLAALNISTKFSKAAAVAAGTAPGSVRELLEYARASNNSTALLALVSLGCYSRCFKLSYYQCAFVSLLLLGSTAASWCIQPAGVPLEGQELVMWTNLAWVVLASMIENALVRSAEKVRRRLFHLQRVMEKSHTHLLKENQMLQKGGMGDGQPLGPGGSGGELLDLESPVQKVLNMLRQMHGDSSLLEWHAAIDAAVHKLSRAKLHDLFLPSAVALHKPDRTHGLPHHGDANAASGSVVVDHTETEMVEQILHEVVDHNDQDEVDMSHRHSGGSTHHTLDDGVLVEDRRQEVMKAMTKKRFGKALLVVRAVSPSKAFAANGNGGGSASSSMRDESSVSPSLRVEGDTRGTSSPDTMGQSEPSSPDARLGSETSFAQDARLRLLAANMTQWGSGEQTIFGLQAACGPDLMFFMLEHAFREFDLFETFSIDASKLANLASAITEGYKEHPYHNATHGCDVLQGTYWMLRQKMVTMKEVQGGGGGPNPLENIAKRWSWIGGGDASKDAKGKKELQVDDQAVWECMPRYAVLAALLSGAMHDIGHDGHNNAFHVATSSELALRYNDKSCLESMHTSTGLSLLRKPENDVLEHMSVDQRRKFRALSIDTIMGTDLAHHFEQLSQIQTKMAEGEGIQLSGEKSDLALLLGNLVHAADLGSTACPPVVYFNWMQRVFREFFYQGEQERKLGLPVTPFMDRPSASIPKAQLGFIKYLCQPLFKAMAAVVPSLEIALDCMTDNVGMLTALEESKFGTEQIMTAGRLQDLLPQMAPPPRSPGYEMPVQTLPSNEA